MYIKIILTMLLLGVGTGVVYSAIKPPAHHKKALNVADRDTVKSAPVDSVNKSGLVEHSLINMPFGKYNNRFVTGAVTVINPSDLLKYDNTTNVTEALSGLIPGTLGGVNIRGFGGALVVVDGVPRSINSVNINEVEQVTILKDANAAVLYGVQANNDIIMITTKRGRPGQKLISARVEYGLSTPTSLPKYLGSADYMQLYNEALANDGLPALYSAATIDASRSQVNTTRYPDVDYYSSSFLKNVKPSSRVTTEFAGGNESAQYYVNLAWLRTGSLLNAGTGKDQHTDRLNMRSNMDFKLGKVIKAHLDLSGIFDLNKTPNGNFFGDASTLHPNYYPPLIDTALVSNKALIKAANIVAGGYLLGGTSLYKNNVYGNLNFGGYNNQVNTSFLFSNGFDVDLKAITPGLSFKTNLSLDFYNQFVEYQTNTYAVYEPTWTTDVNNHDVLTVNKIGSDNTSGVLGINNTNVKNTLEFSGMFDYKRTFGKHAVSASAIAYFDKITATDVFQSDKHIHLGLQANDVYDGKYIVNFSSALVTSPKLPAANRVGFSPTAGLGWIVSNEDFLKENSVISFLKLRGTAGIINTDMRLSKYYSYENIWAYAAVYTWNDGTKQNNATALTNIENQNLFYEKREEINIGAEAGLFKNALWFDANYFTGLNSDQIVARANAYPSYLGGFVPSENYGEDKYHGLELGITWKNIVNHDMDFDIGSTMLYRKSTAVKRDELYGYTYLNRAGKSTAALFGLQAIGLFQNAQDIASSPVQSFGAVQPGDIKYKDQNNDGVINTDDETVIGSSAPNFVSGLNIRYRYKAFTFFALATASFGYNAFTNSTYYWVYGDLKFSEQVLNRWTPATAATATYPRLTSKVNNNNFRQSTYWMYDNSRINITRLQLNYDLPKLLAAKLKTKELGLYIRGSNLITFSKNHQIMDLSVGSEPQYRFYSAGIKALF